MSGGLRELKTITLCIKDYIYDTRELSCAERGVWVDFLLYAHKKIEDRGVLRGTVKELAEMIHASEDDVGRAIEGLRRRGTADISIKGDVVEVVCRRIVRDEEKRSRVKKRVSKYRSKRKISQCNADVTLMQKGASKSLTESNLESCNASAKINTCDTASKDRNVSNLEACNADWSIGSHEIVVLENASCKNGVGANLEQCNANVTVEGGGLSISKNINISSNKEEDKNQDSSSMSEIYIAIQDEWNAMAGVCGAVKSRCINGKLKASIRARVRERWWKEHYREALGAVPRLWWATAGSEGHWRANLEWFLRPDTVRKIVEGGYGPIQQTKDVTGRSMMQVGNSEDFGDR